MCQKSEGVISLAKTRVSLFAYLRYNHLASETVKNDDPSAGQIEVDSQFGFQLTKIKSEWNIMCRINA